MSYANARFDLSRLDLAVSEIRRYCQVLDFVVRVESGPQNLLRPMLARIRHSAEIALRDTCILSGWLEQVLKDKNHPARAALVWQNLYFGGSNRRAITLHGYVEAGNSPLYMHPEILDEVLKYVYLPPRIVKEWRIELQAQKKNENDL